MVRVQFATCGLAALYNFLVAWFSFPFPALGKLIIDSVVVETDKISGV